MLKETWPVFWVLQKGHRKEGCQQTPDRPGQHPLPQETSTLVTLNLRESRVMSPADSTFEKCQNSGAT
ncbi:hypothetical protein T4D_6012 [Trichinella pseudospiralis]|uniref:Uncharacterized protein n=1 Tax=Trichinella pseudospiralis TaxID=6337 RepID=A0A0V1FBA7_TRIPS|nr:hypothetical protein T4D_6012 [Trichinella pseudospiralis]